MQPCMNNYNWPSESERCSNNCQKVRFWSKHWQLTWFSRVWSSRRLYNLRRMAGVSSSDTRDYVGIFMIIPFIVRTFLKTGAKIDSPRIHNASRGVTWSSQFEKLKRMKPVGTKAFSNAENVKERLFCFHRNFLFDPISQPLSPFPTNSSEKNQVEQTKSSFIDQNQTAFTGLRGATLTNWLFYHLIRSFGTYWLSHVAFLLRLSICIISAKLSHVCWSLTSQ